MARDYFDESKKKKKTVARKPQSSSANAKKNIQTAQQRGQRQTANTNYKAQQSYQNNRTTSVSGRSAASTAHRQDQQRSTQPTARRTTNAPTATNMRRNTPTTAAEMRRQQAQNQKSTAGVTREQQEKTKQRFTTAKEMMNQRAEEGRKQKMGENSVATKEQKETVERAIRNTPSTVKKAALDAGSGYMQTLTEIAAMTASSEAGARAKAMKLGYEYNDTEGLAKVKEERRRTVKAAREDNKKLHEAQKKRQEEFDKKTKGAKGLEKAYYGALESGTGMLADIGIGAITGTGQAGSLASMYMRTFGSSTNQARDEGATDKEARRYGFWQSNKEVGTELMFPGAGLAKKAYGKAGLPLAERAANRLIKGLSGRAADVTHAGLRLGLGMGEENVEEGVGWLLDPVIKEFTYGKNVRKREAKDMMNRISEDMRSKIADENDAASASAYLSSDAFLEDTKKDYMEEGLSEKEAEVVANKMRDFLTASLTGDTETMERLEDEISKDVAKAHNILEDYSGKELLETIASTSLLTGVTGLPGSVTSSMRGAALRDELGEKGIRALAKTAIDFEDETDSYKGQAARDRLDSGKELTSTQVYELAEATQKQIEKDSRRQEASVDSASKRIKAENLIAPYGVNANGEMVIDDVINEKFETNAKTAETTIKNFDANREEGQKSLTDTAVRNGSRAIARWKAGVFTVEDANELNYSNTAVRSAFEEETGVDLGQYVVKDKNGKVDIPKTNAATKDALFAMASDNLVESAREATVNWMDNVKGEVVSQVTARMGAEGSLALQSALDDVDERNRSEYMMVANASDMLYQSALNIGTEWDNVKAEATKMFPNISENKLQAMYEAGLADRDMATDKYRGKSVRLGESLANLKDSDKANVTGQVFVDTETPLKGTVVRAFTEVATNLGVDIHLVDNLPTDSGQQANGMYDKGTIYINVNSSFEQNMGYIFMHEVTHHLKEYAPEEYAALEKLVREKWFEYDDAQMQSEIAKKIDLYNRATDGKQKLTEEEALEEIIADAAHEFLNDQNFANEVAEDNPSLAEAVLESIRNALRMLRRILSTGSIDDETHMNSLFSQLDIFDEAERLWLTAYRTAVANKAALAIDNWQDEVNRSVAERYSISNTARKDILDWFNSTEEEERREAGGFIGIGTTPSVYFPMGIKETKLQIGKNKIQKLLDDHPEMSINKIIDAIEGLENPMLVLQSATQKNSIVVYGEVYTDEGKPIMSSVKFNRVSAEVEDLKYGVVTSAYARSRKLEQDDNSQDQHQIDNGRILYVNPDKEKTDSWLNILRLQLPSDITSYGYINKLAFYEDLVKSEEQSETAMQRALREAGIVLPSDTDVRFSISAQQDADYMKAVESGDMETAQRMVDEAANAAGYDTSKKLYHGTDAEFNVFEAGNGQYGNGVYLTYDEKMAKEYGKNILSFYTVPLKTAHWDELGDTLGIEDLQAYWEDVESRPEEFPENDSTNLEYHPESINALIEAGYDSFVDEGNDGIVIFPTEAGGIDSMVKSADPVTYDDEGNVIPLSQRFNTESNDIRFSLNSVDAKGKPLSDDQRYFFRNLSDELKDENGNMKRYYHGTARGDRVGYIFDPARATSGPMAFFTDNPTIAENYSKSKADTSIAYEESDMSNYHNQFTVEVDGEDVNLEDYWNMLTPEEQQDLAERAGHVTYDWDEYDIIYDENVTDGTGGYMGDPFLVREAKGNVFRMLIDEWLDSGNLYGEEEKFLEVMNLLDVKGVKYHDPNYRDETVFEQYLNITNPFVTRDVNSEFADNLEKWLDDTDLDKYKKESAAADMWDKNSVDPYDWLERIRNDIEHETTHAWTSIPDVITAYLQEQGYDGIVDEGGKYHDAGHQVVIPFSSEQVKDIDNEHPTDNPDKRYSLASERDIMNTLEDNFNEYKEDKQNLRIATEAIRDLQRVTVTGTDLSGQRWSLDETASQGGVDNRADSGISSARTIAKGITSSLVNEGYIDFIGQKVESPEDLAKLGQVLRDPRFETFRLVLTKGNKIVSFQSCSARMPGLSPVHNEASDAVFYEKIKEQMDKLGADGYYLMHNHPSGDVTASEDDRRVTANAIFKLGSEAFKGHVILDHDKFGLISNVDALSAPGSVSLTNMEAPIYGQQTIDLIHEPEIDHPLLGEKAKNGEIVASIGEKVNTSNDYSVVIYVSSKLEVRGIQEVSNKEIEKDLGKFKSFIREQGVEFGSISALLYSPSGSDVSFSTIENLFGEGVILDAVYGDTHFFDLGLERYGDPSVMGRSKDEINSRITVYESVAGTQDYNSIRYSITPKMDADYINAVNSNNMEEAQKLVDEAAKMAGYGLHVYHGTLSEPFTRFKRPAENWSSHGGGRPGFIYASVDEDYAAIYSFVGEPFSSDYEEGFVMEGYMNIDNMIDVGDVDGLIFKNNGWDHPDYENDPESLFSKDATKEFKNLCKVMDMTPYELVHALGEELYYDSENIYQLVNSPEFAQLIKDKGYDGIKLLESGSDAYGVLEPTQIKSADTVTYAEDGSIIPLSERFNPENDDIRYSLPTQSSQGSILSDGQMEYFKNSQARDKDGRLVEVFHTTNNGGFTVFDPSYSDDHRSLFFASNWDVSQTYGRNASQRIDPYNMNKNNIPNYSDIESLEDAISFCQDDNVRENFHITVWDSTYGIAYSNRVKGKGTYGNRPIGYLIGSEIEGHDYEVTIYGHNDLWLAETRVQDKQFATTLSETMSRAEKRLENLVIDDKKAGYYKCYLNLENPFIVDAKGGNWNAIHYTEGGKDIREDATERIDSIIIDHEYGFDDELIGINLTVFGEFKNEDGEWEEFQQDFSLDSPIQSDNLEEIQEALNNELYDTWSGYLYYDESILTEIIEQYVDKEGNVNAQVDMFLRNGEKLDPDEYDTGTYKTRELASMAQAKGHDGVIIKNCIDIGGASYFRGEDDLSDIYIAFSSNQVKDVNNLNPTENPDIRFSITPEDEVKSKMAYEYAMDDSYEALEYYEQSISDLTEEAAENRPIKKFSEEKIAEFYAGLRSAESWVHTDPIEEEDAVRMAQSKNDFFANLNAKWNDRWTTGGEVLNVKSVKTDVRNLVMGVMQNSDTDSKYKSDLVKKTLFDVRTAFQLMKQDRPEVASELLYYSAQRMIDNVQFYVDGTFDQYKELKHYLRTTKISLGEEYWEDVDYDAFRKRNYNRINLVKGKTNVDQIYQELEEMFPEWFNEEETMSVPDQLLQIEHVLDSVQPYKEAYSSEAAAELAFDIADSLYDIMMNGDEVRSLADTYKARYDAKTKAMKQRHAEAMLRVRKARDVGIQKERQKFREYKEKPKATRDHRKHYQRIQKNYDWLVQRILDPTKDKNVPEDFRQSLAEMLQTLDMQTENSKKLEAKTGHVAYKTFKMRELKDRLNEMAIKKGDNGVTIFELDANVGYLMDSLVTKLDGQSVDALDATTISEIDTVLAAIGGAMVRHNKIRIENKSQEISEIAGEITEDFLKQVEKRGKAKKYEGIRGGINAINTSELTPVYFFERLGKFNVMYNEVRYGGFDTYVRNEKHIIERMEEITKPYFNKGKIRKRRPKPGSELDKWRDSRSAQTFNLTNGSITLTTAQMMSLYCLSKREQAMKHMYSENGGIVATPIDAGTKQQKIKDRLKGKVETNEKLIVNEADVQTIIAALTPEQINVADQLQQLMANDMADLGNEAHREMYGYNVFEEQDYFPIKVHGNEIATDINDIGDVIQKIKSFGPAKPLDPHADNLIEIDDIFSVTVEHCNGMNLYNAFLVPISDFMRVYNYKQRFDDGMEAITVKDALEAAHGKKALDYIVNFMKDINGIKPDNRGGLEGVLNKALGTAKKTAVFGNIRVALQQPTAIVRALAEIKGKHLMPFIKLRPEKGVMEEMWKYCPIAYWKSLGYYDAYMGRDLEDTVMNNWSMADAALSDIYGSLDNWTWSLIWRAVKSEQAEAHPEMDKNSEEFLQMCGRRASEVFDKTQVVDSTFHRSDAMRSNQIAIKSLTAFMSEPTLTLNVFRAGWQKAIDQWQDGDKVKAAATFNKTVSVIVMQAALVSLAQAMADAWRGKDPGDLFGGGDDDDDKDKDSTYLERLMHNLVYNFFDNLHLENNIYIVKDAMPLFNFMMSKAGDYYGWNNTFRAIMGWDQEYLYSNGNLIYAGGENIVQGIAQIFKKLEKGEDYDKSWYDIIQKTASGVGTFVGVPAGTLMRDFKPILDKVFENAFAADGSDVNETEYAETVTDKVMKKLGYKRKDRGERDREKAQKEYEKERKQIQESVMDLEGEEKAKKTWSKVTTYIKEAEGKSINDLIAEGEFSTIDQYRDLYLAAGNDPDYFDERMVAATKKAFKKTISYEMSDDELYAQQEQRAYLSMNGVTDAEISEICYKSAVAKDVKVAMRLGDEELVMESVMPLVQAGITQEDFDKLWTNRNRIDLKKYDGRYKDQLKSTGTYTWPCQGTITSGFGGRSAPTAGASSYHQAIDIGAAAGTPVGAADGGVVVFAGWNGPAGKTVKIQHDDGTVTQYSHLQWWDVKEGDSVGQGQEIGLVGSTGVSTGPHLHFGVMKNGKYVDPMEYLS